MLTRLVHMGFVVRVRGSSWGEWRPWCFFFKLDDADRFAAQCEVRWDYVEVVHAYREQRDDGTWVR